MLPKVARDTTNSGMRSKAGFSHHMASAASHTWSMATAAALNSTNSGRVSSSHGFQMAAA